MIPYFPPAQGGRRLALGLKVLAEPDWLEFDAGYRAELAEKSRLIHAHGDQVFQALPASEAAQAAVMDILTRHLDTHHRDRFRVGDGEVENLVTGETARLDPARPLLAAARLVQEDIAILAPSPDGYRLIAALIAFPTRWRLADKMGKPLRGIHAPVPGYDEKLARPMDRLFQGLGDDRVFWRANYSLLDNPALFQPGGHFKRAAGVDLTPANLGEKLRFRVERQTLRRLPGREIIVFTIRIHQAPLQDVVTTPERAGQLRADIAAMPAAMKRYKSLPGFEEALTAWLAARAATTTEAAPEAAAEQAG